jgi:hypothetical protein
MTAYENYCNKIRMLLTFKVMGSSPEIIEKIENDLDDIWSVLNPDERIMVIDFTTAYNQSIIYK